MEQATLNIPTKIHSKLKLIAIAKKTTMRAIVETLLVNYIKKQKKVKKSNVRL